MVAIGELAILNPTISLPEKVIKEDKLIKITLTIGYFNILKDYYEQDIKMKISKIAISNFDDNWNLKNVSLVYGKNIIEEISQPMIIKKGVYYG